MTSQAEDLTTAVTLAWQLRASKSPDDAIEVARTWISRPLPETVEARAELGELYRCASLCAEGTDASLWRERALLLFALASCGNGLATLLIPVSFGLLKDPKASPALALNWLDGMTSLIGTGCTDAGPSTSLTERLHYEKLGYLQHEDGRFEEAAQSYSRAQERVDRSRDPRAWAKVRLGSVRPKWELSTDHAELLLEQRKLVEEVRSLGDRAADILDAAERNLELMHQGARPAQPYEVV